MATVTREQEVLAIIDRLLVNVGREALGAIAVGTDGVVLAARVNDAPDIDHVGAVAATIYGVTRRAARDVKQGDLDETIIKTTSGYLLIMPLTAESLIVLNLNQQANLGMARLEVRAARRPLAQLLVPEQQFERSIGS